MGPLLNDMKEMVTKSTEALDAAFTLVFMSKIVIRESQVSDSSGEVWSSEDLLLAEEN